MSKVIAKLRVEGDSEGYVTFECPFCESEFKLNAEEFHDEDNVFSQLFCPYCGLTDKVNHFYSKELIEQATLNAQNYVAERINKELLNLMKNFAGNNAVKVEVKELKKSSLKELKEQDTTEEIFACPLCGNHVKVIYCVGASKIFCAYCGVDL